MLFVDDDDAEFVERRKQCAAWTYDDTGRTRLHAIPRSAFLRDGEARVNGDDIVAEPGPKTRFELRRGP